MKIYKKWKRMEKSTKIGLATSAIYAASAFALPAFANTVEEPVQPVFQPVNLEEVTTAEQAENIYNTKLAEYALDKKIESKEITELVKVKDLEVSIVKEEFSKIEKEGVELTEKVKGIDTEISSYQEKLVALDTKLRNPNVKKILEKNLERLEKELLFVYPGLLKKGDFGVVYDGETALDTDVRKLFDKVLTEANKTFKEYLGDNTIDKRKFYRNIRSVLMFYNIISEKIASIPDDSGDYEAKKKAVMLEKQALTEKIKKLEAEKILIIDSEPMKQLAEKIKPLQEKLERITSSYSILKKYDDGINKIKEYKEEGENKDFSRFISLSFIPDATRSTAHDKALAATRKSLDEAVKSVADVKSYFKEQGFDVELVDKVSNPARTILPLWLGIPLALVGPMLRNMALIRYLGSGKASGTDYGGSTLLGLLEGFVGVMFVDGLHPLVLPIRMVGVPLAWHGILRLTGGDKAIYDYAK